MSDQLTKVAAMGSHFLDFEDFGNQRMTSTWSFKWPEVTDYTERSAQHAHNPSELAYYVYLILIKNQSDINHDFQIDYLETLENTVNYPNKVDMYAFFFAAAIQARTELNCEKPAKFFNFFPYANMREQICTIDQIKWWEAAVNVSTLGFFLFQKLEKSKGKLEIKCTTIFVIIGH